MEECKSGLFGRFRKPSGSQDSHRFESCLLRSVINSLNLNAAGTFNCKAIITFRHMFYYVYILKSLKNDSLYIGYTSDLKNRIKNHNSCKIKSTKNLKPWRLVYYEAFVSKNAARKDELFLKTGKGRERLKFLLKSGEVA